MIALIYFLPLAVMFFAYSVIGFTLWRRGVPGYHAHGANSQYLQAKKKVGWLGGWTGRGGAGWGAGQGGSGPAATLLGSRPALRGAPRNTGATSPGRSLNSFFQDRPTCPWSLAKHNVKGTSQNVRKIRKS